MVRQNARFDATDHSRDSWFHLLRIIGFGLSAAIPIATAFFGWYLNERSQFKWRQFERKEERYYQLIENSQGFYVQADDSTRRADFLRQLNLSWLYAPDEVIKSAYAFLESVQSGSNREDSAQKRLLGEFVLAVRRDMISGAVVHQTLLAARDFQHLRSLSHGNPTEKPGEGPSGP